MLTVRRFGMICLLALCTIGAAPLGGCSGKTSDKDIVFVTPDEAQALAEVTSATLANPRGRRSTFIDSRANWEYVAGHIPDAINLPFNELSNKSYLLDGYTSLIVYGRRWNDPVADAMSKKLIEMGFSKVRTLKGGFEGWVEAGKPIEPEGS